MILGIDPGKTGALALYFPDSGALAVHDMPVAGGIVDVDAIARLIDDMTKRGTIEHAFIERAQAMPKQGVSSVFTYGTGYGELRGVLAAHFVPRTFVGAAMWKRALQVPSDKDGARLAASRLLPRFAGLWVRAKDHGRAEAALIAVYGARTLALGKVAA